MTIPVLIILTVALPIAWLVAEFRCSPGVRRIVGLCTILWSFGVAALVGSLSNFNANAYFSGATKELLEASVQQLRAGRAEVVLREFSRADAPFTPTYENRGRYKQIVQQAIEGMSH